MCRRLQRHHGLKPSIEASVTIALCWELQNVRGLVDTRISYCECMSLVLEACTYTLLLHFNDVYAQCAQREKIGIRWFGVICFLWGPKGHFGSRTPPPIPFIASNNYNYHNEINHHCRKHLLIHRGIYGLHCNNPLGGDQDALASLLESSHVIHLYLQSMFTHFSLFVAARATCCSSWPGEWPQCVLIKINGSIKAN